MKLLFTKTSLLIFTLFLQAVTTLSSAAPNSKNISNELVYKLTHIKTMQANFKQTMREGKKTIQNTQGIMSLQRPGKFRWQTKTPNQQLIVADGKTIWIYDKDLDQVTIKDQNKTLQSTPALLLSGNVRNFIKQYRLKKTGDHFYLSAIKSNDNFQKIELAFRKGILQNMILTDALNQITRLSFSKIRINKKIQNKQFAFRIPRGVDVIRES